MAAHTPDNDASRIHELLEQLTLHEKLSLLSGANMWETVAVPRLNIGCLKMTDGPAGARGKTWTAGCKSSCLPCGPSLGATWSTGLLTQVGKLLGVECTDKRSQVLLAPNLNIHRSPLGGRMFENFSEDPYLTGILASAEVQGIQSTGVAAAVKHFVGNEQESRRFNIDDVVDEKTLREVYLKPFQMVVERAKPWALMTSYNKVNGEHADESSFLLRDILRKEWGWDGLVISDWGGTNSLVPSLLAGTDIEMPGPPVRRKLEQLLAALETGDLLESTVNDSVSRLLYASLRTGRLDHQGLATDEDELSIDRVTHRRLLRQTASEGLVLLKNNGILPLTAKSLRRVAFIGPNAKTPTAGGSGSAVVAMHHLSTPFQSFLELAKRINPEITCAFAPGILTHKLLPLISSQIEAPGTEVNGMHLTFYKGYGCEGTAVGTRTWATTNIFMMSDGDIPDEVRNVEHSFLAVGIYQCATSGRHCFGLSSVGQSRLYIDGALLIDNSSWSVGGDTFMNCGSEELQGSIWLEQGKKYRLEVRQDASPPPLRPHDNTLFPFLSGLRLGCLPPVDEESMMMDAVKLAEESDVAILVLGLNNDWEREGVDRTSMKLPRRSEELIHAVCKSNANTIVVNQSGCPISMIDWVDEPAAIVQAWYQGQENGTAIADLVLGHTNPSGKLSITFPRYLEDHGSFHHFPGDIANDRVEYKEGLQVGYKWFDAKGIKPLFEFGYGLSYTSFAVRLLGVEGAISRTSSCVIKVAVENTGLRAGAEVIQVYVSSTKGSGGCDKNLKAFEKIFVEPGQVKTCDLCLGPGAVEWFDPQSRRWRVDQGKVTAYIGVSCTKIIATASIQVLESWDWL